MSRMQILGKRFRGSSSGVCDRISGARTYFYYKRGRVLSRMRAINQCLGVSSVKGYLPKARKNDLDFFSNLIGREFALAINRADVFKLNIQRRNGRHFNFYYGETRQGKKVALLEVF